MSIELVMPSNHLILGLPLLLLPSIFPSIMVFSNELALCIRWPKYWSFSFSISPSNEYSGLIFFRMDSLDLLAVQGTLRSLLQHHSTKASILQHSAFFMVQLSHDYWKNHSFDCIAKWYLCVLICCLGLSKFFPRSKCLLISWLQSRSAVIFGAQENKVCHCFHCLPIYLHEVIGLDAMTFIFWMLSVKPAFSLSSFTFIKRLFSSSLLSALRVVLSACLRWFIFLWEILIPACALSSLGVHMMHSGYTSCEEIPHVQGKRNTSKMVVSERASESRQTETTITEN